MSYSTNSSYVIGFGTLGFMSMAWFLGFFLSLVSGYSPPIAMLLAITGLIGSVNALKRGIVGSSIWLRFMLIVSIVAAVIGLAGAVWLGVL